MGLSLPIEQTMPYLYVFTDNQFAQCACTTVSHAAEFRSTLKTCDAMCVLSTACHSISWVRLQRRAWGEILQMFVGCISRRACGWLDIIWK